MQIASRPTKKAIFAFYFIGRPRQTFWPKTLTIGLPVAARYVAALILAMCSVCRVLLYDYPSRCSRCWRMVWMKVSELTCLTSTPSMRPARSLVTTPLFIVSKQAPSSASA